MPSSMTHHYFMQDVYNKLDDNIKNKIIINNATTYAQGPDIFYFYNMGLGKKNKKYSKMGNYIHKHKVNLYFENIIKYIIDNKLTKDNDCISFLYGAISHYVLDSTAHPFIFYKTGVFIKGRPSTYKYNGLHQEMEYYIDAYMIFQNEKVEAKDFKIYKYLLINDSISNNVLNLIGYATKETYNFNNLDKIYNKCIKDMKRFYRYFNYDHYGIKKNIYTIIDVITPKRFIQKRKFSFYLTHNSKKHYLNLEKSEWNHPCNLYEIYNYSFIELYRIAISKCCNIINEVNDMLEKKEFDKEKIDSLFNNLSYTTGKDCDGDDKMKYFEF